MVVAFLYYTSGLRYSMGCSAIVFLTRSTRSTTEREVEWHVGTAAKLDWDLKIIYCTVSS